MDCDDLDSPPEKMAKLDDDELTSLEPRAVMMEERFESWLIITKDFCKKRTKNQSETDELFNSLTFYGATLLNDDAISDWKPHMHNDINLKCKRLVELCVYKMDEDSIPVLNALELVLDSKNKFNTFNASKPSDSVPPGSDITDEKLYARPLADSSNPRGWLVDLVNRFGDLGGFVILLSRFQPGSRILTVQMIHAILRPIVLCYDVLTSDTIVKYLGPVVDRVQAILNTLTVEELKEDAENYCKISSETVGTIVAMKFLASRLPEKETIFQNLESLKVRLIFNLVEVVDGVADLSTSRLYMEFNVEEWNNFQEYFPPNWKTANENTREKILIVLQKWASDCKDNAMIHRVLELLWDLAHSDEISTEIMEKALSVHSQILSYFSPEDCVEKILIWLEKCVEELQSNDKWSLPALRLILLILDIVVVHESNPIYWNLVDLESFIHPLQDKYQFIDLMMNNLRNYTDNARRLVQENPDIDEKTLKPDSRYNHTVQVQKRLDVVAYSVKFGEYIVGLEHLKQMWELLVEKPVFAIDRERCFKWFKQFSESFVYFGCTVITDFVEQNVLQFDPTLLTARGIQCFEMFFMDAHRDEKGFFKSENLIGREYLWRVVINCPENIAWYAFSALEKMNKNLGEELKRSISEIQSIFITECRNQLQVHSEALSSLARSENFKKDDDADDCDQRKQEIVMKTRNMSRIMKFMEGYIINKCGWDGNKGIKIK